MALTNSGKAKAKPQARAQVKVVCPRCNGNGKDPEKSLVMGEGKKMRLAARACLMCGGGKAIMATLA